MLKYNSEYQKSVQYATCRFTETVTLSNPPASPPYGYNSPLSSPNPIPPITISVPAREGNARPAKSKWKIEIIQDSYSDYLQACVTLLSLDGMPSIKALCTFVVKNDKGETLGDTGKSSRYELNKKPNMKISLISMDQFFLSKKVEVQGEINVTIEEKNIVIGKQLNDDLWSLLDSGIQSDVSLQVKDHKFPAHKGILAARSPFFEAMFRSEMMEKDQKVVVIKDVEPDIMKEMLDYIYTDRIPSTVRNGVALLEAADRFSLDQLIDHYQDLFVLSIENAAETLITAHQHNIKRLKIRTLEFIFGDNNFVEVKKTTGWKDLLKHEDLVEYCFDRLNSVFAETSNKRRKLDFSS